MWDIKLNSQTQTSTKYGGYPERRGLGVVKGKEGQIYGERRKSDCGW